MWQDVEHATMSDHEVQSIGIISLAKILAVMGLLWGVLMVVLSLFVGMMGVEMMGRTEIIIWLVGAPIYGAVVGAITAIVYNAAASLIGGVELDLD